MRRVVVMGIGSLLHRDDGFGVHLIRHIERSGRSLPSAIRLVDAGTSIVDQLDALVESDHLICVDVAEGGGPAGTIYRFRPEDVRYRRSRFHDAHKLSIFDVLIMVECMRGRSLDARIVAVEPAVVDWGLELSPRVRAALEPVASRVLEEAQWLVTGASELDGASAVAVAGL